MVSASISVKGEQRESLLPRCTIISIYSIQLCTSRIIPIAPYKLYCDVSIHCSPFRRTITRSYAYRFSALCSFLHIPTYHLFVLTVHLRLRHYVSQKLLALDTLDEPEIFVDWILVISRQPVNEYCICLTSRAKWRWT